MPESAMHEPRGACESSVGSLSLEEAWTKIDTMFPCVTSVREVPLLEALDTVLAQSLVSPINLPPFENSAMDGYAFSQSTARRQMDL